ncbi:MAG: arsenate reductase family protein [Firmicutes bacterium]|nr:arsenate reductase family protein [Bacillota bacterium]
MLFMEYPPCGTCKKARKWLEENGVDFTARHIKEEQPTLSELKEWHGKSGLPMKKFFNTSGKLYRELELKDKLPTMSDEAMLDLLATDGMLVKRPIAVLKNKVLVGFKEAEWEEFLK